MKKHNLYQVRLRVALLSGLLVLLSGTIGYTLIEGWPLFDSLYMTIITLATIGYQEVHALSLGGRVFTILLICVGIGVLAFLLDCLIKFILEEDFHHSIRRRKLEKMIKGWAGHTIVCGYGRMGRIICNEFIRKKVPHIVIENELDEESFESHSAFIKGDATSDETLMRAGVERAANIITVLSTDVSNLYAVMSAKEINPKINIIARAQEASAQKKLIRAGATKVVLPYDIGGYRIVDAVLKPTVVDFIEFSTTAKNVKITMEEIFIQESSPFSGVTIEQSKIRSLYGVIIIGVKQKDGSMNFNPRPDTLIEKGDTLIIVCEEEKAETLKKLGKE